VAAKFLYGLILAGLPLSVGATDIDFSVTNPQYEFEGDDYARAGAWVILPDAMDSAAQDKQGCFGFSVVRFVARLVFDSRNRVKVYLAAKDTQNGHTVTEASRTFAAQDFEQGAEFADAFVRGIDWVRCPSWEGTVNVAFEGRGPVGPGTVTVNSSVKCVLKREDSGLATCQVSTHGTIDGEDTKSTTDGGGPVRVKIDVSGGGLYKPTTVKFGTFKIKTKTSLTMTMKTEKGGSYTVSNSVEQDQQDGGWEFVGTGPENTEKRRVGGWTSPDGFTKVTWDLTYKN
jgi:hypothetical protein